MEWLNVAVLAAVSVLGGMRLVACLLEWRGERQGLSAIWKQRELYGAAGLWLLCAGVVYGLTGKLAVVRLADLAVTYLMLAIVDGRKRVVPDEVLLCFLAAQLLLGAALQAPTELLSVLLKGVVFAVLMLLVAHFSGERMGMGDAKLLGVTAMTAGWGYVVQILVLAAFPSFFYSIWLLLFRKARWKEEVPFVPFLAVGVFASMVLLLR
ncbi:MAG: A24 family peptidase [Eubacteriales bacterium]|nr:A24 family peptidase [Eubacteriales bacterium]